MTAMVLHKSDMADALCLYRSAVMPLYSHLV